MLNLLKALIAQKRRISIIAVATLLLLIAVAIFYVIKINKRISSQRDELVASAKVEVEQTRLRAPSSDGLTIYMNASDVRAVAVLADTRYLATSGGLVALDEGGTIKRRYTTLDGLTDNDLTALAVFRERLFIGTATAGLMAFDGNAFTGYSFVKPKATRVSILLATETELLVGTLDGGLFEYDGEQFSRRFNSATGADFNRVTALLPYESRLYIGTQDSGLYIWREAHIEHLTTNEGLPSPHVTALAAMPPSLAQAGQIAVATDFAVIGLSDANEIKPVNNRPNVTSLATSDGRLWAGFFDGGLMDLSSSRARAQADSPQERSSLSETPGLPRGVPAVVYASEGKLWALTGEGLLVRDERATAPLFETVVPSLVGEHVLTGDHITSLALDNSGRLWIGYFDSGIDLVASETNERLTHIEDDRVREVNFIAFDSNEDQILAATSRGLVVFDGHLKQSILTRDLNGLVNDSIAHVSIMNVASPVAQSSSGAMPVNISRNRALVLATAGGMTEITGGRVRSLTAFHGLTSNHLYSSVAVGSRLFVGSLAGLVEIENLRVVRTYKTSNSRLSHDWVTALAEADGKLFIGTNGGGVDALLPTGEWISFADDRDAGKFEVNQNAMHFDGERLYVGTSDRGLLVYNTRDRRWKHISAGLASQSVTAITSDDHFIYVGTMNGLVRIEKRIVE
ncbi:MAG TPA: two-component regulator propeller domain-containing protein [Blastocatellia bacterium]|nr:two-component regulator propeller domain-containing protein [Blastocatellia bacterium]